ncbi:MAG: cytochrome c biogenesis protein ResB [Bdellovibrionota bacterium]
MLGVYVDRVWDALASVKLTIVILVGLLIMAIPGTVVLQYNVSNVDPGLQYGYNFWAFGQAIQLFTAYHSFWYTGLIVILAINLIACSVNRWPQMLKLAIAKPVLWSRETFLNQPKEHVHTWSSSLSADEFRASALTEVASPFVTKPVVLKDSAGSVQIFWQIGRWARISNYLVHTSLLVIFLGAIISALYGFEGAANIPSGDAVDTLIVFKEGKASGLQHAEGGLINEKLLGFRIRAKDFRVKFYDDFPGRPRAFITRLQVLEDGVPMKEQSVSVNEPLEYKGIRFYQASYGRMNNFEIQLRAIMKDRPLEGQVFKKVKLGESFQLPSMGVELVALQALGDVQGFGPGVQFQPLKKGQPDGKPFWVLKDHQQFDFDSRQAPYGIVVDEVEEMFYTGLQIAYDPGAPIYWWGCLGMLVGTFYALFMTHRKYYLNYENGEVTFTGVIHRLPFGFEEALRKKADKLRRILSGTTDNQVKG